MKVQRALRKRSVARATGAHGVVRIGFNARRAKRVLHRGLRHQSASRGRAVADDGIRCAPNGKVLFVRSSRSENGVRGPAERIVRQRRAGEAAVEAEVHPIVHFVALAPPEEALRVVQHSRAIAKLDELEEIVHVGAGEKNGVGKIHDQRGRGVVRKHHVAAEERGAAAGIEKTRAAGAGEAENSCDDVGWARRNVCDHGALAAACGPARCGAGLREVALARFENHANLMNAGRDAACGGSGTSARSSEAAGGRGKREMRSVRDVRDGERSVVAGDADAAGGYELARDESMRGCSLYRGRGGCRSAAAGSGEAGCAGDVRKLRDARSGDDRKRTVVAGDADSRDAYGLSGRKTVRGRRSDGDEKTVFCRAIGAGGDGDGGWLRRAIRARRDGDDYVFVEDRRPCAGAALADTIKIRVVELARQIVARFSVADGQVFPAEERRGIPVGIRRKAAGNRGKSSWRGFFIEDTVGVQQHRTQGGVRVGYQL